LATLKITENFHLYMIYIVPTPIGNLDDVTVRGIKVLSKAKVILCEDGKITSKLLNLLKIENKPKYINLVRNNKFNESGIKLALSEIYGKEIFKNVKATTVSPQMEKVVRGNSPYLGGGKTEGFDEGSVAAEVARLNSNTETVSIQNNLAPSNTGTGSFATLKMTNSFCNPLLIQNPTNLETDQNVIAIVTDAGTPGISDPAFEIIQLLQGLKLDYTVLPGATACIPAIVTSNLISKEFVFLGFLPLKKGRQTIWKEISQANYPLVIYESCHRIAKLIEEIQNNLKPKCKISISQEISKKHENTWIGEVSQISSYKVKDKGEFVVVIKN
jgi:16S rRNA C1402 (ribose-2'-O) methylase RsmI